LWEYGNLVFCARFRHFHSRARADAHDNLPTHFAINNFRYNDLPRRVPVNGDVRRGFRGACDTVPRFGYAVPIDVKPKRIRARVSHRHAQQSQEGIRGPHVDEEPGVSVLQQNQHQRCGIQSPNCSSIPRPLGRRLPTCCGPAVRARCTWNRFSNRTKTRRTSATCSSTV
jgi:hypothetical protein